MVILVIYTKMSPNSGFSTRGGDYMDSHKVPLLTAWLSAALETPASADEAAADVLRGG